VSPTPAADDRLEAHFAGRVGDFQLDAALSAPASGVTAIVGASGCGKSTLLRCLAGLTRLPGTCRLRGTVWQDETRFVPPHRRAVGLVFQDASLLAHLSVRGNLTFGLKRSKAPPRFAFDEVVAMLGLGALLHRSTAQLSGGERQRTAIGRALLSQPDLLLMDEPVSSLDPASKAEILPYLERTLRALSLPVIYVSHDPAEVGRMADRVLLMQEGRIAEAADARAPASLAGLDQDRIEQLALAALRAGLTA
jgi:molybdate transport system ATP-binding protein